MRKKKTENLHYVFRIGLCKTDHRNYIMKVIKYQVNCEPAHLMFVTFNFSIFPLCTVVKYRQNIKQLVVLLICTSSSHCELFFFFLTGLIRREDQLIQLIYSHFLSTLLRNFVGKPVYIAHSSLNSAF